MSNHIDPGLARHRWYRPRDPEGVSQAALAHVRERLKALDPRLDVWWNADWKPFDKHPGRWAVVYWMEKRHVWSIVYYWETATGEYRALEIDCVEPILNYLAEIDADRAGKDVYSINRKADEINDAIKAKAKEERIEAARERMDEGKRLFGQKIVSAPNYIRSRKERIE